MRIFGTRGVNPDGIPDKAREFIDVLDKLLVPGLSNSQKNEIFEQEFKKFVEETRSYRKDDSICYGCWIR